MRATKCGAVLGRRVDRGGGRGAGVGGAEGQGLQNEDAKSRKHKRLCSALFDGRPRLFGT